MDGCLLGRSSSSSKICAAGAGLLCILRTYPCLSPRKTRENRGPPRGRLPSVPVNRSYPASMGISSPGPSAHPAVLSQHNTGQETWLDMECITWPGRAGQRHTAPWQMMVAAVRWKAISAGVWRFHSSPCPSRSVRVRGCELRDTAGAGSGPTVRHMTPRARLSKGGKTMSRRGRRRRRVRNSRFESFVLNGQFSSVPRPRRPRDSRKVAAPCEEGFGAT